MTPPSGSPGTLKVLDVVQFYSPISGGVRRYISDKARFFSEAGDLQHAVVVPSGDDDVHTVCRSVVYAVKSPRLPGSSSYRMLLSGAAIRRAIAAEQPDLIEVGDPYRAAWITERIGHELGIPVVAYYHSDYPRALGRTLSRFVGRRIAAGFDHMIARYLRRLYNRMDCTVVATERTQRTLKELGIRHVRRVPLGTDPSVFRPLASRMRILAELGLPADARLLLYVGRIAREKNIVTLLEMMKCLRAEPAYHLLAVGDGEQRRLVERDMRRHENVTWWPYCDTAERLCEVYSAADLLVHAGLHETFGLATLEAQAAGVRVLSVQNSGMDEILDPSSRELTAESCSAELLADSVRRACAHPDGPESRLQRHARVARNFTVRHTYGNLAALYREVVEGVGIDTCA